MVKHTPLVVHDAHTHRAGSGSGESPEGILTCFDLKSWQVTEEPLSDVRAHNDYCADVCSRASDQLLGFVVLTMSPRLGGGSLERAVDLMIEEARRCHHELGLRGVKLVPAGWYPNDPQVIRLYRELESLKMYALFHSGIFLDGAEGTYWVHPAHLE